MRELAGCGRCGCVQMIETEARVGEEAGSCPRCGAPLRVVGRLGARLLARVRRYPWERLETEQPRFERA